MMETFLIILAWAAALAFGIFGPDIIMIIKGDKQARSRRRSWKLSRTKRREDA